MIKHLAPTCLLVALYALMLPGCMVGPGYSRPETAADTNDGFFGAGAHNQDVNAFEDIDIWWQRFADETTFALVEQMLEGNYDLKAAAARVIQAQAALAEVHGRRLPGISYDLTRDRSKRSFNFGGRFSVITETWAQNISVGYVLDLFGKLRRAERAALAQMLAVEANERALINSMIATVIKARIDIATIGRRLDIARANTASRSDTLEIVERRFNDQQVIPDGGNLGDDHVQDGSQHVDHHTGRGWSQDVRPSGVDGHGIEKARDGQVTDLGQRRALYLAQFHSRAWGLTQQPVCQFERVG